MIDNSISDNHNNHIVWSFTPHVKTEGAAHIKIVIKIRHTSYKAGAEQGIACDVFNSS